MWCLYFRSKDNGCDCELSFIEGIMALHACYFLPNCIDNYWVQFALDSGLMADYLTFIVIFLLKLWRPQEKFYRNPKKNLWHQASAIFFCKL